MNDKQSKKQARQEREQAIEQLIQDLLVHLDGAANDVKPTRKIIRAFASRGIALGFNVLGYDRPPMEWVDFTGADAYLGGAWVPKEDEGE